jgi:ribose 5-phosphate isomerase A
MATNAQLTPVDKAKQSAAYACADEHIRSGMRIGVGSGSTAKFLVDWIHERYSTGAIKDIICVPTSFQVWHNLPLAYHCQEWI